MVANRRLLLLFSGQILAGLGSGIFDIALIWYVLGAAAEITDVGFVIFLRFIPYAFFGVLGGWLGDRWDRRSIIVGADVFRAAVAAVAGGLLVMSLDLTWLLAVSAFLLTVARTLFQPAIQGMIPSLCEPDGLARANAVHHGIRECLGVVAPLVGSLLIAVLSAPWVLGLIAGLFLAGAVCTGFVPATPSAHRSRDGLVSEYRVLIRSLNRDHPRIQYALILNVTAVLGVAGVLSLLLPAQIKGLFPDSPERLGLFMGLMAAGTIAGAILVGWVRTNSEFAIMYLGWLAYGFLILLFAVPLLFTVPGTFGVLLVVGAVLGAVGAVPDILFATAVQRQLPDQALSKTFALFSTFANLGEALSAPLLAFVMAAYGLPVAFAVGGGVAVISALAGLLTLGPSNRATPQQTSPPTG